MAVATARTVSLRGSEGHLIDVQVDVSAGVVGTVLVGRPDASLAEARDCSERMFSDMRTDDGDRTAPLRDILDIE